MRLLALILLLSGCAAKKASTPPASEPMATEPTADPEPAPAPVGDGRGYCWLPERGMCSEFPADAYASGEELCATHSGQWTTAGCPTDSVLGYCTNPEHGGGAKLTLYANVYPDAESARADKCVDEGDVWEAR